MQARRIYGLNDKINKERGNDDDDSLASAFAKSKLVDTPVVPKKSHCPPVHDVTIPLQTNLYRLKARQLDIPIYTYNVLLDCAHDYVSDDLARNDLTKINYNSKLLQAVEQFQKQSTFQDENGKQFILAKEEVFVDTSASKLFAIKPLPGSVGNPNYCKTFNSTQGNLSINRDGPFKLNLRAMCDQVGVPSISDAVLDAFINTAINQSDNFNRVRCFQLGETRYDKKDSALVRKDGEQLLLGQKSTVERIEGDHGITAAVAVNVAANWFFERMNLLEYCMLHGEFDMDGKSRNEHKLVKISKRLKGTTVFLNVEQHYKPLTLIAIINQNPAATHYPLDNNRSMYVTEFLRQNRGYELRCPEQPVARVIRQFNTRSFDSRPVFYPLEVLTIESHQLSRKGEKFCSGAGIFRQDLISKTAQQLQDQTRVASLGLVVANKPMNVTVGVLHPPKVVFDGNEDINVDPQSGKWELYGSEKFIRPAKTEGVLWIVFVMPRSELMIDDVRNAECGVGFDFDIWQIPMVMPTYRTFAGTLKKAAACRGLHLANEPLVQAVEDIEDVQQFFSTTSIRYVLFVMAKVSKEHDLTKCLEREYQVITQTVLLENVRNIVENPTTTRSKKIMEHVVMKMNLRLGGYNNDLRLTARSAPNRLFIGLTLRRAKPGRTDNRFGGATPAVVGFGANFGTGSLEFLGDFLLQYENRDSVITKIDAIVGKILKRYVHSKRVQPDEVYIYRNLEDFEYQKILQNEIPRIQAVLPMFTYIAVTKRHNVLFFPTETEASRSIMPGTVIDRVAVDSTLNQFYLTSYGVTHGCPRPPRFSVLADHGRHKTSLIELEKITLDLTFAHQTSTNSLGIPAPLTVAKNYAHRGLVLVSAEIGKGSLEAVNPIRKLNNQLCFAAAQNLKEKRVTA